MRIEVTRRFRDLDALTNPDREGGEDPVHEVGAKLTVDKDRGADLIERGFAVDITATPATTTKAPRKSGKKSTAPAPAPAPVVPPAITEPAAPPSIALTTPAPAGN